jgi:hypothetical protein
VISDGTISLGRLINMAAPWHCRLQIGRYGTRKLTPILRGSVAIGCSLCLRATEH